MKRILLYTLALLTVTLSSCQKEPGGGSGITDKNYWNSNDLTKMRLKGAVKTLQVKTYVSLENFSFDTRGNITGYTSIYTWNDAQSQNRRTVRENPFGNLFKSPITGNPAGKSVSRSTNISTQEYKYDHTGRLTALYTENDNGEYNTLLFSYGGHGAYIPFPLGTGYCLKQNLARVVHKSSDTVTTEYKITPVGQSVRIYGESTVRKIHNDTIIRDTFDIRLNASKLPVAYTDPYGTEVTMSYYPDQMLKEVTMEKIYPTGDKTFFHARFLSDDTYQLVKETETTYDLVVQGIDKIKAIYLYDDRKEVQKESLRADNYNYDREYTYTYDDHGNWTRQKYIELDESGRIIDESEAVTRTITYY